MSTMELTQENLESILSDNAIVAIDFWASWCGPCTIFGPIFEEASERHDDILFAKCNTEEQMELASSFGIRSIPTLALFRDRILVYLEPGALPGDALEDLLEKVKELDMDEIRARIDEENREKPED